MKLLSILVTVFLLVGCGSGYEVPGGPPADPPDPTFRTGDTADPPDPTFRPDYDAGHAPIPDAAPCDEGYSYCTSDSAFRQCVNGVMVDAACGGNTQCVNQTVNSGGAMLPSAQCVPVTQLDAGLPPPVNICDPGVPRTCEDSLKCCRQACANAAGEVTDACLSVCNMAYNACHQTDPAKDAGCTGGHHEGDDDDKNGDDDHHHGREHKSHKHH